MKHLAILLILAGAALSQPAPVVSGPEPAAVELHLLPTTMAVKEAVFGDIPDVGLWTVYLVNGSDRAVVVPDAAVYVAAQEVGLIPRAFALRLMQGGGKRGVWAKLAAILRFALPVAAGLTIGDVIATPRAVQQALVLALPTANEVAKLAERQRDDYAAFDQFILPAAVALAPGGHASYQVFARVQGGVRPHSYAILLKQ